MAHERYIKRGFQNKEKELQPLLGSQWAIASSRALSLCLYSYMGFPGTAGAGPRGMHPSPNLGIHQLMMGWLLPTWKEQPPSDNAL